MHIDYHDILQDVARYNYIYQEGFWDGVVEETVFSPAAEEGLCELSQRVTADLGLPHSVARQGLLHALHKLPYPLGSSLLRLAMENRQAILTVHPVNQPQMLVPSPSAGCRLDHNSKACQMPGP